jgi:predicted lipoprotein
LLCCALSAQCSTPRPREQFASAAVRDVSSGQASDAGDSGAIAPVDASAPRDAAISDAAVSAAPDAAADAGSPDAGSGDAGATDSVEAEVLAACGEPPISTDSFSREKLREAGGRCAVYHYCAFKTTSEALVRATDAYANERAEPQLKAAQAAYRTALLRWSRAELFQFGPAASASMSAGRDTYQGKGLRDRIYAWPTTSRCRVEEQLAEESPDPGTALISARGLFALDYTLFFSGSGSECAAGSRAAMVFGQLPSDQLRERKARYAAAVASDLRTQSQALIDAWSPSGGNFLQSFTRAEGYPSEQEALNVLGWALIYVEREMKDWKLGIPAGYTMTAPVSLPESPYAQLGSEALRENLLGFRALFQGCGAQGEGLGFDDWLNDAGHAELAADIVAAYERSQRALDMLAPLQAASKEQLDSTYQTLRELTSLLKGDLFGAGSPLGLKLPASVEGDTD